MSSVFILKTFIFYFKLKLIDGSVSKDEETTRKKGEETNEIIRN